MSQRKRYYTGARSLAGLLIRRRLEATSGGGGSYAVTKKWSELSPLPTAGSSVTIPSDWHVQLDVITPALQQLTINGKLSADTAPSALGITAETILVSSTGVWEIGSAGSRYTKPYTITLTGNKPTGLTASQLTQTLVRQIQVNGGRLHWFGDVSRKHRVRLNLTAAAGATALMIEDASSGWKSGDDVAISPTDFYDGTKRTHRTSLAADASGFGITLSAGLNVGRYGSLQYINDGGLSTTDGTLTPDASWPGGFVPPRVLDERAMLVNVTRNIVVQGNDDSAWNVDGWGADVMVMGRADQMADQIKVSGVRFRRVGKRGVLGHYPFHWHMLSYSSYDSAAPTTSGKDYYGLCDGHYITDCAIEDSANRGIVVHGTNGVRVERNVAVSIRGHCFFLENGSEMLNSIRDNAALLINDPHPGVGFAASDLQFNPDGTRNAAGTRLAKHEADNRTSCYWITNPKNDIVGNWAADSVGIGFWFSFAEKTFGPSRNVLLPGTTQPLKPRWIRHGVIEDNFAQCHYRFGGATELPVQDEAGNITNGWYTPTVDDLPTGSPDKYTIKGLQLYKCGILNASTTGAYLNRVTPINYDGFVMADCMPLGVHGSAEGSITRSTFVGRTLNTPTARTTNQPPIGVATYHFSVGQDKCMFVNLPHNSVSNFKGDRDLGGGAMDMQDLYLYPVETGSILNRGSKYIGSHAGYRCKTPWMRGQVKQFSYAGALWDPAGYWGPAGNHIVYGNYAPQNAFFTHNATGLANVEPAADSGAVSISNRVFGISGFRNENNRVQYVPGMPLHVYRLSSVAALSTVVGEWHVDDYTAANAATPGAPGTLPQQMRHFVAVNGGIYRWAYPYSNATPQAPSQYHSFAIAVNQGQAGDSFVIGIPWDAATAKLLLVAKNGFANGADIGGVANTGTPVWNDGQVSGWVASNTARLCNVAASSVAEVADATGNAAGTKIFNDRTNKLLWFRYVGGLTYPVDFSAITYPSGRNPTAYVEQYRQSHMVYLFP